MAKTGGRVKALREKLRHQERNRSHGGFARFSVASVETREAHATYYSGDNTAERFRPVQERSAFHKMARQGEWTHIIPANEDCGIERRDGGYHRQADARAVSVNIGDAKIRKVATHKVATREHLRDSLGTGSLLNTCWSQPKRGTWALYNPDMTRKG
jgi:hypothetical protein